MRPLSLFLALAVAAGPLGAQDFAPPQAKAPDEETLKAINEKTNRLRQAIDSLRRQGVADPYLAEVQVFHKAAVWIVRHNEFFQPNDGQRVLDVLDRGLLRAKQLAQGEAPWLQQTGSAVVRAYRSRIDGSVQPFAVTLPEAYGKERDKKWRLDVVLHGRDTSLTEVKFLNQHRGDRPAPVGQNFIRLDIFGRGNNAYRWAGESDVIEAIDAFVAVERFLRRDALLDPARVVLRGFSMGGAGTWHLGLHSPDRWCVLGPGAGFTTTHGYVKNLPEKLPPEQEACLRIYDAVDYGENVFNVPVVAYGGGDDPQLQAARNIEAVVKQPGFPGKAGGFTLLVAPGLGHQFPPEWQQKAEAAFAPHLAEGRPDNPSRVRFVTYTLKYSSCFWVLLLGLDRHYERALVDAEKTDAGLVVKTANVRALRLTVGVAEPVALSIDGQKLEAKPWLGRDGIPHLYLEKRDDRWSAVLPHKLHTDRSRRPQKVPGLHGPIDDAFTGSFLCVRGTGQAWNAAAQQLADAGLERFRDEWSKFLRADLPIKDDTAINDDDIAGRNLILFGDPGSNSLIAQVVDALPLSWTRDRVALAGKSHDARTHVPALIYPSPLNAVRYVVLNSGHTFHAADFRGTNALLYPRLGDYAILGPNGEAVSAGLFDEFWQIRK